MSSYSFGYKIDTANETDAPGPGQYNVDRSFMSKQSFQSLDSKQNIEKKKQSNRFKIKNIKTPGPGQYEIQSSFNLQKKYPKSSSNSIILPRDQKVTSNNFQSGDISIDQNYSTLYGANNQSMASQYSYSRQQLNLTPLRTKSFTQKDQSQYRGTLTNIIPHYLQPQPTQILNETGPGQYDVQSVSDFNTSRKGFKFEQYSSRKALNDTQDYEASFYNLKSEPITTGGAFSKAKNNSLITEQANKKSNYPDPQTYFSEKTPVQCLQDSKSFNKFGNVSLGPRDFQFYKSDAPSPAAYFREKAQQFLENTPIHQSFTKEKRRKKEDNRPIPGPQTYVREEYMEKDPQVVTIPEAPRKPLLTVKSADNIMANFNADSDFEKYKKLQKQKINYEKLAKRSEKIGSMLMPLSLKQTINMKNDKINTIRSEDFQTEKMRKKEEQERLVQLQKEKKTEEERTITRYQNNFPQLTPKQIAEAIAARIPIHTLSKMIEPGPGAYEYKSPSTTRYTTFYMGEGQRKTDFLEINEVSPGPAFYDQKAERKYKSAIFGSGLRKTDQFMVKNVDNPGIQSYNINKYNDIFSKYKIENLEEIKELKERTEYNKKQLESYRQKINQLNQFKDQNKEILKKQQQVS